MNKRIDYLDIAKGIGILFVVLGHNHIKQEYPIVYQVVYSFHMPFFFLLSGMFFKQEYSFLELVQRRFNSLLKPFIAYLVIVYSASIFFTKIDLPTILGRIPKALYAGPNTLEWVPLWFLPHLFLVNLFAFIVVWLIYKRLPYLWLRLVLLAGMFWVGAATLKLFWPVTYPVFGRSFEFYGLPWSADLLLITSAFFLLGYEIRRSFLDKPSGFQYSIWVFLIALAVFVGLHIAFDSTIDFYIRSYEPALVSTLEAISGSVLVLYLAKWLEKSPALVANSLKYLGRASIVLLIFHFVPQEFLYPKLADLGANVVFASITSFGAGVLFPVLLYAWVIRPNPWLSAWFGLAENIGVEKGMKKE